MHTAGTLLLPFCAVVALACFSGPSRAAGEASDSPYFAAGAASPAGAPSPTGVDAFESFRRAASLGLEPLLLHGFSDGTLLAHLDALPEGEVLPLTARPGERPIGLLWREGNNRVAALDDDGDMGPADRAPDRDSDCVLVDLGSDGILDRAVDWIDLDHDGAADVQVLYEIAPGGLGSAGVAATLVFDLDRDGRFFHVTDYTYRSNHDMWESDFDGNVCFVAAERDEATGRWTSAFENPFCFFDADGDGTSDEALRLEGRDLEIESMRWSFDADGDAAGNGGRDYDVSLTARGRVLAPASLADSLVLRDGRSVRWVAWERARDLARWAVWGSVLLVWDEDDHNVAPHSDAPDRERWEGVIAEEFAGFPAVGGPPCGRAGKRYELDRDGSGRLDLYWSGVDGRIHLTGAEAGELSAVLGGTTPLSRTVRLEDKTQNAFFDSWTFETDGGGAGTPSTNRGGGATSPRTVIVKDEAVRPVPLDLRTLRAHAREILPRIRAGEREETSRLESSARGRTASPVRRAWDEGRERDDPWAARTARSPEAQRLLENLILWDLGGGFLTLGSLEANDRGVWPLDAAGPRGCSITVPVDRLPEEARGDLSLASRPEIVAGGTRVVGQAEDADGDGSVDRLTFLPFPWPEGVEARLVLEPAAPLPRGEQVRVDPWFPGSVAFEAIGVAYRSYGGRLDLLQKKGPRLILRTPLGDIHAPQYWGIDPLDVGEGPGLGGIYVQREGAWTAWFGLEEAPEVHVEAAGPQRAVVRVELARGDVRLARRWTLQRGDRHIEEELEIEAPAPVTLSFALAGLETSGALDSPPAIWTYGVSVEAAGAIALAGTLLDRAGTPIEIDGHRALRVETAPRDSLRLAWLSGGPAQGDPDAEAWARRVRDWARTLHDRRARCP